MDRDAERQHRIDRQNELTRLQGEVASLKIERDRATAAFRKLRSAWFVSKLRSDAHCREWEDESRERSREIQNTANQKLFDEQTEAIISGQPRVVVPWCMADLDKELEPTSDAAESKPERGEDA